MRILVTGSRNFKHPETVYEALRGYVDEGQPSTLVVGGCRSGADEYARQFMESLKAVGYPAEIEMHFADWEQYDRAAGQIRNQEMVDSGADICLAFIRGRRSAGTADCVAKAITAGIPVRLWVESKLGESLGEDGWAGS